MSSLSLGVYLETLLADHTDQSLKTVDIYAVAAGLGFLVKKVSMMGTEVGILTPNPTVPFKRPNPLPDNLRTRIELNQKFPDSTLRPVVAWLLAGFLNSGNPKTQKIFRCEVFETKRWRDYRLCNQMFLATRLLIPSEIIDAYCENIKPGMELFDTTAYAKKANIDGTFLQCCYASTDVEGLLGMLSGLDITASARMKDAVTEQIQPS